MKNKTQNFNYNLWLSLWELISLGSQETSHYAIVMLDWLLKNSHHENFSAKRNKKQRVAVSELIHHNFDKY